MHDDRLLSIDSLFPESSQVEKEEIDSLSDRSLTEHNETVDYLDKILSKRNNEDRSDTTNIEKSNTVDETNYLSVPDTISNEERPVDSTTAAVEFGTVVLPTNTTIAVPSTTPTISNRTTWVELITSAVLGTKSVPNKEPSASDQETVSLAA